ncbi:hypothetical protein GUITHDRAFT_107641 [Guillardia theta CCMP2712]|uniref:TBC1 domain family member 7 n=1 Tax=Guillardia theta (strain CCMP2712) TaxID=905079 RepID=L1JDR1_GUITC|nr:hypothetical protein GUITHDRAFT_107641 [Guillardia theta CCMP2712]EKX46437.1 hypothetical protein GUITHDRAFT_107641 [Guillardia theta CCMP2712]|mmetsp:Transcript_34796/g.108919  ORF Transcript_34796/g.108919 Transcript_34796/m.108919 type:complete len:666 (-) Transcript_34796:92-2089(-)|eukprot:XP_005833417.1 hypothetical protein GUITHDRAFT_107641 [Guillardia theta CCMP2712]
MNQRIRLLRLVGVAPPTSCPSRGGDEEKKEGDRSLDVLLSQEVVDLGALRSAVGEGKCCPSNRLVCWRLVMGILPPESDRWCMVARELSDWYEEISKAAPLLCKGSLQSSSLKYMLHDTGKENTTALISAEKLYREYLMKLLIEGRRPQSIMPWLRCDTLDKVNHSMTESKASQMYNADDINAPCIAYVFSASFSHSDSDRHAIFWCYFHFMELFSNPGCSYKRLHTVTSMVRESDPDMVKHVQSTGLDLKDLLQSWFRTCFTVCLSIDSLVLLWDRLLAYGVDFSVFFAIALLNYIRPVLLRSEDKQSMLQIFLSVHELVPSVQDIIASAITMLNSKTHLTQKLWRPKLNDYCMQVKLMVPSALKLLAGPGDCVYHSSAYDYTTSDFCLYKGEMTYGGASISVVRVENSFEGIGPETFFSNVALENKIATEKVSDSYPVAVQCNVVHRLGRMVYLVRETWQTASGAKRDLLMLTAHVKLPDEGWLVVSQSIDVREDPSFHDLDASLSKFSSISRAWLISPLYLPTNCPCSSCSATSQAHAYEDTGSSFSRTFSDMQVDMLVAGASGGVLPSTQGLTYLPVPSKDMKHSCNTHNKLWRTYDKFASKFDANELRHPVAGRLCGVCVRGMMAMDSQASRADQRLGVEYLTDVMKHWSLSLAQRRNCT